MFDTLIKGGTVVDGTGKAGYKADVGIEQDQIAFIGQANGAAAKKEVNASGKIVAPGIIDPHSHADLTAYRADHVKMLEPLVRQGITTFIGGNCGFSLAPIGQEHREGIKQYVEVFTNMDFDRDIQWQSMGEFLGALEERGVLLNMGVLAPHGLMRIAAMGMANRYASDDEVKLMASALDRALDEGAIGLSLGLQYFPGSQSDTRELMCLGQVLKKHDSLFACHLRSYSNTLDKAIDEVVKLARANDIGAQISHLFWVPDLGVVGPVFRAVVRQLAKLSAYWTPPLGLEKPLTTRVENLMAARRQGVRVGVDAMPTTTGFTHLLAFFPPWALTGTQDEVLARLQDPAQRARMRHSIDHGTLEWPHVKNDSWSMNFFKIMGWESVRIMAVVSEENKRLEGMQLVDIARDRKKHPFDVACDLLIEEHGHVLIFLSMAEPEDNLIEQTVLGPIKHPEVNISTDTILMGIGKPSHLFHGCYPKFLGRYVREKKLLSLETAIRKITSLPAEHFGLKNRGKIEKGYFADVLVFDFDTVATRASFAQPEQRPAGIEHVFINGAHVVDGDVFAGDTRPGKVLKR